MGRNALLYTVKFLRLITVTQECRKSAGRGFARRAKGALRKATALLP